MNNFKLINSKNLIHNVQQFNKKKICAMVKSNAYGHGLVEIVKLIENEVECFGVVNVDEGVAVRKLTSKPVLICSQVEDIKKCVKHNLEIMVDNERFLKKCLDMGCKNNLHLKLNCGMNRYGEKSNLSLKLLNSALEEYDVALRSIYTHFPNSANKKDTRKHYQKFKELRAEITQNAPICFGGSNLIDYDFEFDMLRIGIGLYGYERENVLPVLSIFSQISKIFYAKRGEYIGYSKDYKVKSDGIFAVVPVGYGDGLRRNLSNKICVKINEKFYKIVGNICMDAFFVKVDEKINLGDKVQVLFDADYMAKKSGTISYEILTGFSNFRGKTIVE